MTHFETATPDDQAGIETGEYWRPLPLDRLPVPAEVHVQQSPKSEVGSVLVWDDRQDTILRHAKPALGALIDILDGRTGEPREGLDARVEELARRFGPLRLCRCGRPDTHRGKDPFRCRAIVLDQGNKTGVMPSCEPVSGWVNFAREVCAALRIASCAIHGRPPRKGDARDWEMLYDIVPRLEGTRSFLQDHYRRVKQAIIQADRLTLVRGLNVWIDQAALRPAVWWEPTGMEIRFASGHSPGGMGSLYGAVLLELLYLIAGARGFAFCAYCGKPFIMLHQRTGARRFCINCRKSGKPEALAARDYRARLRNGLTE